MLKVFFLCLSQALRSDPIGKLRKIKNKDIIDICKGINGAAVALLKEKYNLIGQNNRSDNNRARNNY